MGAEIDVFKRLVLEQQNRPALHLYALVDGLQYEQSQGKRLEPASDRRALFAGTPDEPLAHAGPWLVDVHQAGDEFADELVQLEQSAPAVSWLFAVHDLDNLARLLQANLDACIPGGQTALLRFWDPRILATLADVLDPAQREILFGQVYEWHFLNNGKRAWVGRHHADA